MLSDELKLKYTDLSDEEAIELMRKKFMKMKSLLLEIRDLLKVAAGEF